MKISNFDPVRFVETTQKFWESYDEQTYYQTYTDSICVEDSLYCLGVSLDPDQFSGPGGYRKFKDHLLGWLAEEKVQGKF